jgi:hypothetical protein
MIPVVLAVALVLTAAGLVDAVRRCVAAHRAGLVDDPEPVP